MRTRVIQSWHAAGTVVANVFLLNLLWLICSLPIVTIIPSCVAMFDTVRRWRRGEDGVIGLYFSAWKRHFWRSYAVGIPVVIVASLLYVEISFYTLSSHRALSVFMLAICIGFAIAFLSILVYLGPLLVSMRISILSVLKMSLAMGMRNCFVSIVSVFPIWFAVILAIDVFKLSLFLGIVPIAIWMHYGAIGKKINALEKHFGTQLMFN